MSNIQRRDFIKGAVAAGITGVAISRPGTSLAGSDKYHYEFVRTEAEWRAMLDEETYKIMREGDTEFPKTSDLWDDYRPGKFDCIACELPLFTSKWRADIDKGWVFFRQSEPDAIHLGIGGKIPEGMADASTRDSTLINCRRCGSHLGHMVIIEGEIINCINGRALKFHPA